VVETYFYDSDIARVLQLGDYDLKKGAIDVTAEADTPKLFGKQEKK
jgi:hypothetical protein